MNALSGEKVIGPMRLLMQVNLTQSWRRLLSIRQQSRLMSFFISFFVLGYVVLSFWLFRRGLKFAATFPGLGTVLVERLLFLLFAFLFFMLLISNLVIGYTNLFRNREAAFLLSSPVSALTIFRWKFLESTAVASWAFLFLVAPLLAAYGMTRGAPWHFYPVTVVLVGLFIFLPALAGSWCAVTVARHLDRRLFQVLILVVAAGLLLSARFWLKPEPLTDDMLETRVLAVLDKLLERTRFALFPLLPSYWLSSSVLGWAEGAFGSAVFFLGVMVSHVLFFGWLAFTRMGDAFYEAASTVQSRGSVLARWGWFQRWSARRTRFDYPVGWVERMVAVIPWIPRDVQAILVKDVRMFWRDTTQWGQTAMLFGLLGVYVINLRHFSSQLTQPFWIQVVSFLNLGACSLNLATLTTRFVYPQFSLEGKRIWIVGMSPLGLVRVIRAKYWLTTLASMVVTLGLILMSCRLLSLESDHTLYFAVAIVVMTLTLNALATGMGTLFPNFREDHPGKIVSGFGGTLCLVLSFAYIVAGVSLLALGSPWSRWVLFNPVYALVGWAGFAALSLLLGWLPYRLGLRKVAHLEL